MHQHSISTIMAVYNGERFVAQAVESVLKQTLPSDEFIVINDGSTDGTLDILRNYSTLRIVSQANQGLWRSLNKGIDLAQGKYLTFIDADDLWHEDKNRQQWLHLTGNPEIDLSFCHVQQFEVAGPDLTARYAESQEGGLYLCLFMEKQKFLSAGYFGENRFAEYILWFQKARLLGLKHEYLSSVLAYRRSHEGNMSRGTRYSEDLPILAKRLIEQRHQFDETKNAIL